MESLRRFATIQALLTASVVLVGSIFATAALATDEPEVPEAEPIAEDVIPPATPMPEPEAEDEDLPWTARYLAPTTMALGVIVLIAAGAFYAVRIRGKYKIVQS